MLTSDLRRREGAGKPGSAVSCPTWACAARRAAGARRRLPTRPRRLGGCCGERPDIVYVWNCLGASQAAPFAALQAGSPVAYRLSELWFASTLYRRDRFVGHLLPGRAVCTGRGPGSCVPSTVILRCASIRRRPVPAAVSWGSDDLRTRVTLPPAVAPVLERINHPGVSGPFVGLRTPARRAADDRLRRARDDRERRRGRGARRRGAADRTRSRLGSCSPAPARRRWRGGSAAWHVRAASTDRVELAGALETPGRSPAAAARACSWCRPSPTRPSAACASRRALARVPVVAARIGGIPEALDTASTRCSSGPATPPACAAALAATLRTRAAEARPRARSSTPSDSRSSASCRRGSVPRRRRPTCWETPLMARVC